MILAGDSTGSKEKVRLSLGNWMVEWWLHYGQSSPQPYHNRFSDSVLFSGFCAKLVYSQYWLQADEASSPKAKDLRNAEETTSSSKKKKREVAEEVPGVNTYSSCQDQILLEVCWADFENKNIQDTVDCNEKCIGDYIYSKQDEGRSG